MQHERERPTTIKIVAHTPTELIIRDSAMLLRGIGAFLAALGAFAIAIGLTQDPDGRVGVVPVAIGSLVALGGVLLVVLPRRKTFAFSRAERVFIIAKERFGRVERQVIPLAQLADVTLEESRSTDNGSTYRISVTLADQRRIPWTPYYTSGLAAKRAIVDLIRDFPALRGWRQLHRVLRSRESRRGLSAPIAERDTVGVHRHPARGAVVHHGRDPR
jgi:hypothetical protein